MLLAAGELVWNNFQIDFLGILHCILGKKNKIQLFIMNKYLRLQHEVRIMTNLSRMQLIKKADEICEFARKIFNEKRVDLLRKAVELYKQATLGLMAKKVEKEADDWEIWWERGE